MSRHLLPTALAGVALGLLLADRVAAPPILGLAAAGGVALLVALVLRWWVLGLVAVLLLSAVLGAWRYGTAVPDPARSVATLVDGAEHELTGVVVDDPRPRADRLQVVLGDVTATERGAMSDRLLVWMPRGPDIGAGSRLAFTAELELAEDFDGFAYREYLARQGIGAIARPRSVHVVEGGGGVANALAGVRTTLLDGLVGIVPEPEAALGAGILLGVRSSIAPEIGDDFAAAGLTHVVAISGWNIAIVAALVASLFRPLERRRGGRRTALLGATVCVAAYVLLTGASPSVVRAALMAGAMLVGRAAGSRAHATSALGLAALVMLLVAPSVLWDVGFQLSLLATAGLIWFGAAFERRLHRWPGWIREPVALTMAAQVTTLPVILVNFERLSLVAPIANVLVVPIVPLSMAASAGAALTGTVLAVLDAGLIGDALAWLAGGVAWLVLRAMIVVGHLAASVPLAAVDVSVPAPFAVAWFPLVGLATWALRSDGPPIEERLPDEAMTGTLAALARVARPLPMALAVLLVLGAITFAARPDGRLHVTVLDIGQGDAILVEAPGGATMLVDGGPDPELTLRRLGAELPFHVRDIDVLVLSHPHQDHVGGLVEVLERFDVGAVLHAGIGFENAAYERLLADAASAGIPVVLARAGGSLALDATTSVEVLYPAEADARAPLPDGDINNGSVVLLLRHGGFTAILTGDAEAPVEATLLARGGLPAVDLLKVGHHGSHSSSTPGFVDALRPSIAIISAGIDNEYGHPAPETLATFAARPGLAVYRTDRDGDVELVTDGLTYRVRTDAGWRPARPVHAIGAASSIGPWPSPTETPFSACSTRPLCPTASASTPPASPASRRPPRGSWRRPGSRSTAGSSRRRRCSMTSTSPRSAAPAASTASSAHDGSRRRATRSSRCPSPPTRSPRSSTRNATRSAGRRSSWPSPTGTWRRSSSPSTSGSTT
ncbi:MAG TPA: DNA internalization-related competence protein ComEC/Rec2 [Candidatus Limnocylindria bacterium]|nr:DNA internalization-related competence protein ComEC/Rec2 [Candidatus Limnocylindria bacterium]